MERGWGAGIRSLGRAKKGMKRILALKIAGLGLGLGLVLSPSCAAGGEDRPSGRIAVLFSGEAHGQIHPHG